MNIYRITAINADQSEIQEDITERTEQEAKQGVDLPDVAGTERKAKWSVTVNGKKYDTLVCEAVRKNPLAFVDILKEQAETAEKDECVSRDFAPPLFI